MKFIETVLLWLIFAGFPTLTVSSAYGKPDFESDYLKIKQNPEKFERFFKELPKGGELHSHIQGAVSPEDLLEIARGQSYWIDPESFTVTKSPENHSKSKNLLLDQVSSDPVLRGSVIEAWTVLNYKGAVPHAHFFNAFGKFKLITSEHKDRLLSVILKKSWQERVSYLELMMNPTTPEIKHLAKDAKNRCKVSVNQISDFLTCLDQNKIGEEIPKLSKILTKKSAYAKSQLNYDFWDVSDHRGTSLRVVYQIARLASPEVFLTHLYSAFLLASHDYRVVGINIVQPEYDFLAIKEYDRQMTFISELKKRFPGVGLTLHAGELTPKLSSVPSSRTHIRRAVLAGQADRIGHGVAVSSDPDPDSLLELLRSKKVLVEVNLSSNQFILGVDAKAHPLMTFLQKGIPVALSTDDAGILRTNMSQEFLKAATDYTLSYAQIKQMVIHSLDYSFSGRRSGGQSVHSDCLNAKKDKSKDGLRCQESIMKDPKSILKQRLQDQFRDFQNKWFGSRVSKGGLSPSGK